VLPPFAIGGPYTLVFTVDGGSSSVLTNAITYYHRAFATNLWSLRSAFAPPRDVGPYSIKDSD
jgi:hypothetical protein